MSNWQEQIYKRLKPMDKLIMNHIKSDNTMNMDETTKSVIYRYYDIMKAGITNT